MKVNRELEISHPDQENQESQGKNEDLKINSNQEVEEFTIFGMPTIKNGFRSVYVNKTLVTLGLASIDDLQKNLDFQKHVDELMKLQRVAQKKRVGMWKDWKDNASPRVYGGLWNWIKTVIRSNDVVK